MALKSREKIRTRSRQAKQPGSEILRQRLRQRFPDGEVTATEASDGVKMSEVLEAFVEPYHDAATTDRAYRKLLTVAATAWNMSLLPEEERSARLDEFLEVIPKEVRRDGKLIVRELMERKEDSFSEYRRMILDLEVTDTGDDLHLTVVSTAEDLPREPESA